eukprot:Lithocolla_globosa_v1_NODE_4164_length_1496_cov_2.805690.p1 type:complete len:184 gc:universal NODE_4164_length_1496_cov_2.805690:1413-862(-)
MEQEEHFFGTFTVKTISNPDDSYGSFTWPSSRLLAEYLLENPVRVASRRVLELGSGTSLPGLVAAKLGASEVTLTDADSKTLKNCRTMVELNQLKDKVGVMKLEWGRYNPDFVQLATRGVDVILAADCFYDPASFENALVTVAYLFHKHPKAEFLTVYQERSTRRSIQVFFGKMEPICGISDV